MGAPLPILPALERASGRLRLSVKRRGQATVLDELYQQGCLKARFPRHGGGAAKCGVLINTTGGLADDDRLALDITAGPGTMLALTSQAAERVYRARSLHTPARIETTISVAADATCYWLPQETILFDGSAIDRCYEIDLAPGAGFLAAEMLVLGRTAMAETLSHVSLFDRWRLRTGGHLVFADGFRLGADIAAMTASQTRLAGAHAIATLICAGPDAGAVRDALRAAMPAVACSERKGVLIARMVGTDASDVRARLAHAIHACDARGLAAPILSRWIF